MEWIFGVHFNRITKKATRPSSAAEARRCHEGSGDDYVAVLRDPERAKSIAAVEVSTAGTACFVFFLDDAERPYLHYLFATARSRGGLFLDQVRYVEYSDDSPPDAEPTASEWTAFGEDGGVHSESFDNVAGIRRERDGTRDSIEPNYEPMPMFGDYASILRLDRDRPLSDQPTESPSWAALATPIESS